MATTKFRKSQPSDHRAEPINQPASPQPARPAGKLKRVVKTGRPNPLPDPALAAQGEPTEATTPLRFLRKNYRFKFRHREPSTGELRAKRKRPPQKTRTALELASDVLRFPGLWLKTPNSQLGNRKPIDLIDTPEEDKVYYLLNAVDHGLF